MASAVLTACSAGRPSDQQIQAQVMQRLSQAKDIWDVSNLHKTNGILKPDGTYVAAVAYDITFKMSYVDAFARVSQGTGGVATMQMMQMLLQKLGVWGKSDTAHVEDSVTFVKSEKGWVIADGQ